MLLEVYYNFKTLSIMTYNYHRRLVGYLHEDNLPTRRSQSQNAYITSANNKLSSIQRTKQLPINLLANTNRLCDRCNDKNVNTVSILQNANNNKNEKCQYDNSASINQYFGSEIKTIRKTLVDIHEQIKNGNKGKDKQENSKKINKDQVRQNYNNGYSTNLKNQYSIQQQLCWQNRIEQKIKIIEQIKQVNLNLIKQNNQLKQNKQYLQHKINDYHIQLSKNYQKTKKIQYDKNISIERLRQLEIQIIDLKSQLMKNQQKIKETNFHYKQNTLTKIPNLSKISEFNVMVNWKKEDENRGSQTVLSDIDIEKGYKEVNQMQDQLCERINGNLKIQKKIFAKIGQITQKVRFIYEKLDLLQESALKMGITV